MGLIGSFDRLFKRPHPLRERCYAYVDGDVSADRIFTVRRAERLSVRSRVRSRASSASLGLLFRGATNSSRPLRVPGYQSKLVALLMLAVLMLLTACGSQTVGGSGVVSPRRRKRHQARLRSPRPKRRSARTRVGLCQQREERRTHPPPKNLPEEAKTFPATNNRNVEGQVTHEEDPPTHGDHAPS